jgi:hypothetical protein
MRTTLWTMMRKGAAIALVSLWFGAESADAQTYYPQTGRPGTWSGYAPANSWSGYAPGSAWGPYAPGTTITVPPGTVPPTVAGNNPTTAQPGYIYVTPTPGRRTLLNGVRYPVRGPSPYADGRPRPYYEYGTGRSVPLAKPWLPGAPGGR